MNNGIKKMNIDQYKSLGEVVFDYLRDAIMNGDLKPDERLMENTIAEQLGVSRTPVREAMKKLEKENFITVVPRKGAYVSKVTAKDILDVLEVRRVLEGFASKLAAERMNNKEKKDLKKCYEKFNIHLEKLNVKGMIEKDREFHDLIFSATKNNKLIDLVKSLHEQFHRFRLIYFYEYSNYGNIQERHKNILQAIEEGNSVDAKRFAEAHVEEIAKAVIEWAERESEKNE